MASGVAGLVGCKQLHTDDGERLRAMLTTLLHRGPDYSGIAQPDPKVLFGHNRLALIDLDSRADPPMRHETFSMNRPGYSGDSSSLEAGVMTRWGRHPAEMCERAVRMVF